MAEYKTGPVKLQGQKKKRSYQPAYPALITITLNFMAGINLPPCLVLLQVIKQ